MSAEGLLVSMIIPAYKRPELLEKAVLSAMGQDLDPEQYEIIVVDSSPDEENVQVVDRLIPQACCSLRCLTKHPEGPGPSRNLGARMAQGRFLAFMDSDCQASTGWLRQGCAAFKEGVGLVQGYTVPEPGAPYSIFNRSFTVESENFIYQALNIFYRRDAFEEAGGFFADEDPEALAVVGGEDVDLAWKVKRAGWRSTFSPEALVTHVVERVTPMQWLVDRRMIVVPRIPRDFPETRRFFFARYFFDDVQAWLVLALAGLALSPLSPLSLLLFVPYALKRGGEQTRALRGPLRVLRVVFYFPRDMITFTSLIRGSFRFRCLLL